MTDETRSIDISVEVPGTPEEVWKAIATGPGISSWFVPHEVEEREGGTVTMDFGTFGTASATVTAWEPPRRVVFQSGGERPLAYEWLVEAKEGGTCVVRLVNTGFGAGEEWDGDYGGMSEGWRIFLQNLRLKLQHFAGREAVAAIPTATIDGPLQAGWATLCGAVGVPTDLAEGDRLATAGEGVPPLRAAVAGRIDSDRAIAYLLVLDGPPAGTAFIAVEGGPGGQVMASPYLYLYGEGASERAQEWTAWMTSRFAAQPTSAGAP